MTVLKINDRIAFLRKQKGVTQEELAAFLNVTNQSVSKWENGSCCPDIQLLPEIAAYFKVSVDDLLGYKSDETFGDITLKIKNLFERTPAEDCFDISYKLAFLLAEGAFTKGYKAYVPWDVSKPRITDEDFYKWGSSVCSEPEGNAAVRGNSVFISSNKRQQQITNTQIRNIYNTIQQFSDKNVLRVFYALYELTVNDFDLFVSVEEISTKSNLSVTAVETALDRLPVQLCPQGKNYRIDGPFMHYAPLLLMFSE